jgi:hypothetical protein
MFLPAESGEDDADDNERTQRGWRCRAKRMPSGNGKPAGSALDCPPDCNNSYRYVRQKLHPYQLFRWDLSVAIR